MTAVVAMVFTAGAFASGSALIVLRERGESATEVTFAEDFDRDDVGLSLIHGYAVASSEIELDGVDVLASPTYGPDPAHDTIVRSPESLTVALAQTAVNEAPNDVTAETVADATMLGVDRAVVDEAAVEPQELVQAEDGETPPTRAKTGFLRFRIPRPTFHTPAPERSQDVKRGPMLRTFLERFTRKRNPTAVEALDDAFALDPGVAQRPYVDEPPAETSQAPEIAAALPMTAVLEAPDPMPASLTADVPAIASVTAREREEDEEDDDTRLDVLHDEISPERRAELDRAAAAALEARRKLTPEPEPVAIAQRAAETVHALAREAEARAAEASRWAIELTGASGTIAIEKRRRLLRFYILSSDRPESRAILERVMREDPDLASEAEAALNKAA
jgi:hypothetical protein